MSFSAAHRYWRPEWPAERNVRSFGACANEPGHGHNYRCHVTLAGPVPRESGMVMDLAALDDLLNEVVRRPFDHQHLNHAVPAFAFGKQIPTAEALAVYVYEQLAPRLPDGVRLERVRIEEDPSLYAEYDGTA